MKRSMIKINMGIAVLLAGLSLSAPAWSADEAPAATAARVKAEFLHGWQNYERYAWGHDELMPLSLKPHDWYGQSLLMTPVDALDTLVIMGLKDEADKDRQLIAARLVQKERRTRYKLPTARQQDNVLQEFQRARAAAILVVDFAVHVIGVCQINELGARIKVAVVPLGQAQACGSPRLRFRYFVQIEEHELARVEAKALVEQRRVHRPAKRHELGLNTREVWDRAHRVEHFFEQPAAQSFLRKLAGNVEPTDETLLVFEDIKRISRSRAILEGHAAGKRTRLHEALDQLQCAAVIPMEFITPMPRLFLEERLNLADGSLPQVDDIHG